MYLSHLGMSLKISWQQRCSSCTSYHSWTAISTSSLQWNWPPPNCHVLCRSSEISFSSFVTFTYILTVFSQLLLTSRMSLQTFSNPPHHFLTNCTLIRPKKTRLSTGSEFQYRKNVLPYNGQWISIQETCFTHKKQIMQSNFSLASVITAAHQIMTWAASEWLTPVPSVACYPN